MEHLLAQLIKHSTRHALLTPAGERAGRLLHSIDSFTGLVLPSPAVTSSPAGLGGDKPEA